MHFIQLFVFFLHMTRSVMARLFTNCDNMRYICRSHFSSSFIVYIRCEFNKIYIVTISWSLDKIYKITIYSRFSNFFFVELNATTYGDFLNILTLIAYFVVSLCGWWTFFFVLRILWLFKNHNNIIYEI